jgi:hypothetical protein
MLTECEKREFIVVSELIKKVKNCDEQKALRKTYL